MALVTRSSNASMDATRAMYLPMLPTLIAGEDLDIAAPCYIKSTDGLVYMCNGTNADEAAVCHGFTPDSKKSGQAVTLYGKGAIFHYSDGLLTPGALLYVGATKGRLDAATTTGDTTGVARAITASMIRVVKDW